MLVKISAQPHLTLCIQFFDRANNDKNNTLLLGKLICFTIVWGCAEILPPFFSTKMIISSFLFSLNLDQYGLDLFHFCLHPLLRGMDINQSFLITICLAELFHWLGCDEI